MVDVRTHASAAVLLEQMEEAGPGRAGRDDDGGAAGRPAGGRHASCQRQGAVSAAN